MALHDESPSAVSRSQSWTIDDGRWYLCSSVPTARPPPSRHEWSPSRAVEIDESDRAYCGCRSVDAASGAVAPVSLVPRR